MAKQPWLLYVLRCRDQSLYCGITNNLPRRLHAHNEGKGSKYTRARRPVEVVFTIPYPGRSTASKAEYVFKQLSKAEKERFIRHRN